MYDLTSAPLIDPKLIQYLKHIYPLKAPSLGASDRQIWLDAGCQKVISHLEHLYEKQTITTEKKRGDV